MKLLIPALALGSTLAGLSNAQVELPAPVSWRWAQGSPISPTGTPVVVDKAIYVNVGQRAYAINAETGSTIWRFPSGDPLQNAVFRSQPIVVGDTLVSRSSSMALYGINRYTGQGLWQRRSSKPIVSDLAACGDNFVAQTSESLLQLYSADTGEEVWSEPLKIANGISGKIACSDSNIYVFTQTAELMCIKAASKKILWNKKLAVLNADAKPVIAGDYVFFNSGSFVVCFNASTGSLRWQRDLGVVLQLWPSVSGDGICVLGRDGQMFSLDILGRMRVKKPIDLLGISDVVPTPAGDNYVAVTKAGVVELVNGRTGQTSWNYLIHPSNPNRATGPLVVGVPAAGEPVVVGDSLVILCQDASIICFDKKSGIDLTPPTIKMVFPNSGEAVSGQPPLQLFFRVDDEASGFDTRTVEVTIDGKKVPHEFTRDGYFVVRISEDGPVRPLKTGRRVIALKVADNLGNVGTETFILNVDNQLRPVRLPGQAAPQQNPGFPSGAPTSPGGGGRGGGRGGG